LGKRVPAQTDVLVQAYVWDHGRLYCRYAPGFAMLLAAWLAVFGDDAAHYLNPLLYTAMVGLLIVLQRRLFGSRWRALLGAALIVLFGGVRLFDGTQVDLWGLTLTRDISAHTTALLGLVLLAPNGRPLGGRRLAAAGLALGFSAAIRNDSV